MQESCRESQRLRASLASPTPHLQNLFPLFCSLQRIDPDSGSSDSGTLMTPPESPHGRRRGRNGRSLPISLGWKLLCESPPQNKIKISDLHFFFRCCCVLFSCSFPFFFLELEFVFGILEDSSTGVSHPQVHNPPQILPGILFPMNPRHSPSQTTNSTLNSN